MAYIDYIDYDNNKLYLQDTSTKNTVQDTIEALKSGKEKDADFHLGFYLDENGDLCQVE